MVQGKDVYEVTVLMLKYDPDLPYDFPKIQLDPSGTGPVSFAHFKWYDEIVSNEFTSVRTGADYHFRHWKITTSDKTCFTYKNWLFEETTLIVGIDLLYWFFAVEGMYPRYSHSFKKFRTNFCSCCMGYHFRQLIEEVPPA